MHTRVLLEKGDHEASLAIDDRIFLGEGLFETIRVVRGLPCSADLHWQRLSEAALQLGIPFDLSLTDWMDTLVQQIKQDNLFNGGLKAILSGGSAPRGLTEQGQVSQLILQTFNYILQTTPIKLMSASWLRDAANPIYRLKSVNYLEAIMARRSALKQGMDDCLFFNTQHHATDTTCANLFVIQGNTLLTPPLSDGVLAGIARQRLIYFCAWMQIPHAEQSLSHSMIAKSDVVFTTNALQGLRLVQSLDNFNFGLNHPLIAQLNAFLMDEA